MNNPYEMKVNGYEIGSEGIKEISAAPVKQRYSKRPKTNLKKSVSETVTKRKILQGSVSQKLFGNILNGCGANLNGCGCNNCDCESDNMNAAPPGMAAKVRVRKALVGQGVTLDNARVIAEQAREEFVLPGGPMEVGVTATDFAADYVAKYLSELSGQEVTVEDISIDDPKPFGHEVPEFTKAGMSLGEKTGLAIAGAGVVYLLYKGLK